MSSQMKLTLANGFFHVTIMSCNRIEGQLILLYIEDLSGAFLIPEGYQTENCLVSEEQSCFFISHRDFGVT